MADRVVVSLEFLRNHDPDYIERGREERYLCPWCGYNKPKDNAHRSCCLNTATDVFVCHRCDTKGKLNEAYNKSLSDEEKRRQREKQAKARQEEIRKYHENLKRVCSLEKTIGWEYLLKKRGIDPQFAIQNAGVRFSHDYYGAPAVLFPMRDETDQLVAVNGRYVEDWRYISHRTAGNKLKGVFKTRDAFQSKVIIICEAPIDALTLTQVGYPSVSTCGSGISPVLLAECANKKVFLATDNDRDGEILAHSWALKLFTVQADVYRLMPTLKDWNIMLKRLTFEQFQNDLMNAFTEPRRFALFEETKRELSRMREERRKAGENNKTNDH